MVGHCVFSYRALYRALFGHWSGTDRALCFHTVWGSRRVEILKLLGFPQVSTSKAPFSPAPRSCEPLRAGDWNAAT